MTPAAFTLTLAQVLVDDENTETEFEACCVAITGIFADIPLTELTATYARYLKLFEDVCDGLDVEVFIEIRVGDETSCEMDVEVRVKNGAALVTHITFNASFGFAEEPCEEWNNFAVNFSTHGASAAMGCVETSLGGSLTAV